MPTLNFERLPHFAPRRFVPKRCNLGDWDQLEALFLKLQSLAPKLKSVQELEGWLLKISELKAAFGQEQAQRYIRMTCRTDDRRVEQAYLHFIQQIEPRSKPHWQALDLLYMACPFRARLSKRRWEVFDRETKSRVELFRPENVPLEKEEARLAQQYQKIIGAMTVRWRGRSYTLPQMAGFLENPDRAVRKEAFRLITTRRLRDRKKLAGIFGRLLDLRHRIARNAGCSNYLAYAFKDRGRFDYTPKDCEKFWTAVETHVVPLYRELQERRRRSLGLSRLRPWDLEVDLQHRPPLSPFHGPRELAKKTHNIFKRMDRAWAADFNLLQSHQLLDLESRKGKAPGGYQYSLEEARLPFIFMNAIGRQGDVKVLLHEAGHAFHALAARKEPLVMYRHAPLEFCEVASMSMELLALPHMEVFYSKADADRARRIQLEGIVLLLPWIAVIDAFQHWLYTHPGHSEQARGKTWLSLLRRFGGLEDWTGLELARRWLWLKQQHLFTSPLYYIEYGIAQLGALQIWIKAKKNTAKALTHYRRGLALGGSRPLPELFIAAGLTFDFSARTVAPLAKTLREELDRLPADGR